MLRRTVDGGLIKTMKEKIRIVGGNPLHHLADNTLSRRQPLADLGDEKFEALIAKRPRRILL
jgi:hypothetical protein